MRQAFAFELVGEAAGEARRFCLVKYRQVKTGVFRAARDKL